MKANESVLAVTFLLLARGLGAADGELPSDAPKVMDGYATDVAKLAVGYRDRAVQVDDRPTGARPIMKP